MQIKRVLGEDGKVVRLEPTSAYEERLRKLVADVVEAGEARDGDVITLPDDLIMPAGIEAHPVKELAAAGAKIVTLDFQVRAADDDSVENPTLIFRATDESEDRHGSVIRFGGWDWSFYMRTGEGVFLYCHDYEFPAIGKTTKINKLIALKAHDFVVKYAVDAWNVKNMPNYADLCYRLAKDNFMPQVSVGFIPKNAKPYTPKTLGIFGSQGDGVEFLEQEGLELSQVTVGSNRNAYGVKAAIRRGIVTETEITASGLGKLLFNSRDVYEVQTLPAVLQALRDPERRAKFVTELPPSAFARKDKPVDDEEEDPKKPKKKPATDVEEKGLYGPLDASLPEAQREIDAMKAVIQREYDALDLYLRGFREAVHSGWLSMMASAMAQAMWRISDTLYNLEWWYSVPCDLGEFVIIAQEVNDTVNDAVGPSETRTMVGQALARAFAPLAELKAVKVERAGRRSFTVKDATVTPKSVRDIVQRVGKVLSKKNFDKLVSAMSLIEEVCIDGGWDPAEIEDAEDAADEKSVALAATRIARELLGRKTDPPADDEEETDDTGKKKPKKKPAVADDEETKAQLEAIARGLAPAGGAS